jgi:uncharacterized Tic20 family protein
MSYHDSDTRKLLSALCHGACFFSAAILSIGIPIALLLISSDPVVKTNAKEALNFHFTIWILGIVFALLCFVVIGFPLLGLLGLFSVIAPIIAIVSVLGNPDQAYRYGFIFHLL